MAEMAIIERKIGDGPWEPWPAGYEGVAMPIEDARNIVAFRCPCEVCQAAIFRVVPVEVPEP
jgi:hypothetical protein